MNFRSTNGEYGARVVADLRRDLQQSLFPLRTLLETPGGIKTVEAWGTATACDTQKYLVKIGNGEQGAIASEWTCSHLAEAVGIPCPTPKVLLLKDGRLAYGSRWIATPSLIADTTRYLTTPASELKSHQVWGLASFLSRVYAFDFVIQNIDRHLDNFIAVRDGGVVTFFTIDFGQSLFAYPDLETAMPLPNNTLRWGRVVRDFHGFDLDEALVLLKDLENLPVQLAVDIVKSMPNEWLSIERKRSFMQWWEGGGLVRRVHKVRKGLIDGSLL